MPPPHLTRTAPRLRSAALGLAALVLSLSSGQAHAGVNLASIPNNGQTCLFPTIAAALAYATDGDTLFIDATDTYEQNVYIDKSLTLVAADTTCTTAAAPGTRAVLKPDPVNPDSVIQIQAPGATVVLQGLEIREGIAQAAGGGLHIHGADVTLDDSVVAASYGPVAGGVFVEEGSLRLQGSRVKNNTSGMQGGGIYAVDSAVTVDATSWVGGITNRAQGGGSVFLDRSELIVYGTIKNGDSTGYLTEGGCIGTMAPPTARSRIELLGSARVESCTATGGGGGVVLFDTDLIVTDDAELRDSAAEGGDGGAILAYGSSTVTVSGNARIANGIADSGGLLSLHDQATLTVYGSTVLEDGQARADGGLIYAASTGSHRLEGNMTLQNGVADLDGGLIHLRSGSLIIMDPFPLEGPPYPQLTGGRAIDGAGIYVAAGGDLALGDYVLVDNNIASGNGGGIYLQNATYAQYRAEVGKEGTPNRALRGAGIYAANSDLTFNASGYLLDETEAQPVEGARIEGNVATVAGGGLALYDSTVVAQGLVVARNRAYGDAAMNEGDGGGIALYDGSVVEAENSIFFDNRARERGGGAFVADGTFHLSAPVDTSGDGTICRVNDPAWFCSELRGNRALRLGDPSDGLGGALYIESLGTVELERVAVLDNGAEASGPHAYVDGGHLSLENVLAANADPNLTGVDGLRFENSGRLTADHLTVGGRGATIDYTGGSNTGSFDHSIVWPNGYAGSGLLVGPGTFLLGACNVGLGVTGASGNSNLAGTDPQFVDFYHLASTSPAIDLCTSSLWLDLDFNLRPSGLAYDSGAFEFQAP